MQQAIEQLNYKPHTLLNVKSQHEVIFWLDTVISKACTLAMTLKTLIHQF
ncbi:hypothetical protein NTGHW29_810026 [Candidatus Nitrotoga sp. HW29]|nr:hypothetical protein NTGHW29_810026 [Candidatus Nitrotoga sp. HW29]